MFEYRKAKKDDWKEILNVSLKDPADYTEWICIQNYLMFNFKQLLKKLYFQDQNHNRLYFS